MTCSFSSADLTSEIWLLRAAGGRGRGDRVFNVQRNAAGHGAVGGVWTPPALRGRGYARAVVAASLLIAREQGVTRAIVFTGEDNIPAQRAYVTLGFRRVGDYGIIGFAGS